MRTKIFYRMIDEILSTRTKHIYKRHFDADKSKLVKHLNDKGHFFDIQGCGEKSNKELVEFAQQERSRSYQINSIKELPSLSTRAEGIFDKYFNSSETELIDYYRKKGHFLHLNNSGKKTSEELIQYVQGILKRKEFLNDETKNYSCSFENLDEQEKEFLEHYLKFLIEKNEIFQTQITVEQLLNNSEEIDRLINVKLYILHYLKSIEEGKLVSKFVVEIILSEFNLTTSSDNYINNSTIFFLKLFRDVKEKIFNETELYIFENYLNYSNKDSRHDTLSETGDAVNLTRERVRQIAQDIQESFDDRFSIFSLLKPLIKLNEYTLNENNHLIVLQKREIRYLNNIQQTNFNHLLINKLLAIIFKDDYTLLGSEKNYHSLQRRSKNLNFSWSYLISNQLGKEIDLTDFFLHIEDLVEGVHDEEKEFSLNFLLFDFSNVDSILKMKEYYESINTILRKEFDLVIYGSNKFTLRRNTNRKNYEYALEVLEEMEPSKEGYSIEVIAEKILKNFGIDFSDNYESLRSAINGRDEFIYFGRSSHYGLKKWEEKFDEIRGGTIKQIVKTYLHKCERPKHIGEIAEWVNKYRNTNADNIYNNLRLDPSELFLFYNGGYVGLKTKDYQNFTVEKINPRVFARDILEKFLPAPYSKFLEEFSKEYNVRQVRLKYIIENKIEKGELVLSDSHENMLQLKKSKVQASRINNNDQVSKNKNEDNIEKIRIDKNLIKKMVEWDTRNGILSTKQQQYLAYFAYDIKKLNNFHKKNVKRHLNNLIDAGFKV
jgi:hypothetical protein